MNPHRPRTTQKELQAFAACAFLCLLRLVGFLARWTDPRARRALKRYLQRKERFVATVLLLTAIVRIRHRPTLQPRVACKPGFRRTRGRLKLLIKSARLARRQAPVRQRILHLLDAFAHPERYIRHFIKRLRRGVRIVGIVAAAPPAAAPPAAAIAAPPARVVLCADSS
ncbi:MAG: hypothetical protein BroJett013_15850 [Alphaproteobacteria bacterium]|nr:MAG: hypothetical protein BroJett013_15850 [Alphaproteobacteria bacterium]